MHHAYSIPNSDVESKAACLEAKIKTFD